MAETVSQPIIVSFPVKNKGDRRRTPRLADSSPNLSAEARAAGSRKVQSRHAFAPVRTCPVSNGPKKNFPGADCFKKHGAGGHSPYPFPFFAIYCTLSRLCGAAFLLPAGVKKGGWGFHSPAAFCSSTLWANSIKTLILLTSRSCPLIRLVNRPGQPQGGKLQGLRSLHVVPNIQCVRVAAL